MPFTILTRLALAGLLLVGARAPAGEPVTAFVGCRILPAADAPAVERGVLVIRGLRIAAVGPSASTKVPAGAQQVDCAGGTLVPGFWNSHVHFLGPDWADAGKQPPAQLSARLDAMLTSHGFVHVIDTGSDLGNTLALARRTASGEVRGPSIRATGMPFVAPKGTPYYAEQLDFPELSGPAQARAAVAASVAAGAGAIKLMTVSLTRTQPFPSLDPATIRATVDEARRRGVKVLAHPTDTRGIELAVDGGVDMLMHTSPIGGPWSAALAKRMAHMALTPTLKLWSYEAAQEKDPARAERFGAVARQQVAAFRAAGGRLLFGTDVGYMMDADPAEEYLGLAAAGLSARDILAMLTSAPAAAFAPCRKLGRLAPGYEADVVLLARDPEADARNFGSVRLAYRAGRPIFETR